MMKFSRFIARQLGRPSGIFGPLAGLLWNRRNAALNETVLGLLALEPADRVLEIGFGGGYLLGKMGAVVTDGNLAGVDISPAMMAAARSYNRTLIRSGRLELKCGPANALPYPDEHFTKACSVNTIFYWDDIQGGLREVRRVLAMGGTLITCFTCKESIEQKVFARDINLYESGAIEGMLAEMGFQDIQSTTFSDKHRQYTCITAKK